ncbi:MAPEG family protein [Shinella sp. CPCC 101442]|uniref:MAPEG family protein n=1 Tax=Shinella sp. CPCC 101442 TaxID=2932265 RepID=UPI0021521679|nr:MAPEG family protein [Shinella sp. CPCC 101442]MCR6499309.1 MAPEG family protein [Shinella sp. CPCC 101442]
MSPTEATIWPVIAHVALVFILYFLLSSRRMAAVKSGQAKPEQFRENRDEPLESVTVRNAIANQFELPVLFYAVSILLYLVDADNPVTVAGGWLFVALRYAHAYVHVTSNRLRYRRPLFIAGFAVLGLLWIWLGIWLAFT